MPIASLRRSAARAFVAAFVIGTLTGCPAAYVRQGHVGLLIDDFTGEIKQVQEPGIRAAIPLREHIVEFPVIVQQYVMVRGGERGETGEDDGVRVNSLEGQGFIVDASVEFVIRSKHDVPALYQRYGLPFDTIVERYYRSRFKAALGTAIASLPLNEAISGAGRRKVEEMAVKDLRATMTKANQVIGKGLTDRLIRKLYVEKLSDKVQLILPPNALYNFNGVLPAVEPTPAPAPRGKR